MKRVSTLFSSLYELILGWTEHPKAPYILGTLSFAEASFFPLPPDLMLAPMVISKPNKAWNYAALTTLCSVIGGIFGYFIGMFFINLIQPYLIQLGYNLAYLKVQNWFLVWGFWALFLTGLVPIPYKLFTLASGAIGMPILPFVGASLVGRSSRFFLVAALMRVGGEKMKDLLRTYCNRLGWIFLLVVVALLLYFFINT